MMGILRIYGIHLWHQLEPLIAGSIAIVKADVSAF